jgi:hypothetical protein
MERTDCNTLKQDILTLQCEHAELLRHALRLRDAAAPLDELSSAMREANAMRARINELQRHLREVRTSGVPLH